MRTSVFANTVRVNYSQFANSRSVADRTTVGSAAVLAFLGFSLSTFSLKQIVAKGAPRQL